MNKKINEIFFWNAKAEGEVTALIPTAYDGDPQSEERCNKCFFSKIDICKEMHCNGSSRADGKDVYFQQVKLEESPYIFENPSQFPQNREENRNSEESPEESPEKPTAEKTAEKTEPKKNDRLDGKPRWELLPLPDLEDIVEVYTFGAEKYGPHTWRDLEDGFDRYKAALLRHLVSFDRGEEFDKESGLPALAHMAWNAIAMLAIWNDARHRRPAQHPEVQQPQQPSADVQGQEAPLS